MPIKIAHCQINRKKTKKKYCYNLIISIIAECRTLMHSIKKLILATFKNEFNVQTFSLG